MNKNRANKILLNRNNVQIVYFLQPDSTWLFMRLLNDFTTLLEYIICYDINQLCED